MPRAPCCSPTPLPRERHALQSLDYHRIPRNSPRIAGLGERIMSPFGTTSRLASSAWILGCARVGLCWIAALVVLAVWSFRWDCWGLGGVMDRGLPRAMRTVICRRLSIPYDLLNDIKWQLRQSGKMFHNTLWHFGHARMICEFSA